MPSTKRPAKPAADDPHYQHMLVVLKQFRVVINNIRENYRDVERATGISGAQLWALYAIASRSGVNAIGLKRSGASTLLSISLAEKIAPGKGRVKN